MGERTQLRDKLTYSNVMVTILAFVVLGGGAYAANRLPKESVGTKQLKRKSVGTNQLKGNAVRKNKIKKNSVNGVKVQNNSLTGADIKLSKLGTVPSAKSAATANTANAANVANSLAPSEGWHEVGAPGEPGFLNSWENEGGKRVSAAFYKDQLGVVHLKGVVTGGTGEPIFRLPVGYRPTKEKFQAMAALCSGGPFCEDGVGGAGVVGSDFGSAEGDVVAPPEATFVTLDGITFRAES